jgi:alkaline phosphatase
MTAIVTGQKTSNGVLSQSAAAVRGKKDGENLQTILEYAEEHGLATGVLSNMNITDATPAACYAHSNDRGASGQIFAQILKPRYGDGVDVVIGAGRNAILKATGALGLKIEPALREKGYAVYDSLEAISPKDRRVVALFNTNDFNLDEAADKALRILGQNRKGYFLMIEWDAHTDMLKRGLEQVVALDDVMRKISARVKRDTLLLFAADHSFDLRLLSGRPGEPILAAPAAKPNIRVGTGHTGEEVVVTAMGPGAARVHGFIPNTQLFHIMMSAYGWSSTR